MTITVTLADPEKCEGCPCIGVYSWGYEDRQCNLGYWNEADDETWIDIADRRRPARCIAEHGR